jgi:Zn-dependent M28 family amino/carboxypeptidase
MSLRDLRFYIRGQINQAVGLALGARRRGAPPAEVVPLERVLADGSAPLSLSRLLVGRENPEREAALAWYLQQKGLDVARHAFATFEGRGENLSVDLGTGDRVLVLVAHHDAVPGSPGANDNAAAVAILLHLLDRMATRIPPGLRVRFLFPAAEERGYLGAREYVKHVPLAGVAGVLSLELCGIGDSVVVWDAPEETPFSRRIGHALGALGRVRDESWHQVGRLPVFGSDHRAFAAAGLPAYGLTVVPTREAEALRRFVFSPVRSVLTHLARRPRPFDTYHTPRDALATLEAGALQATVEALEAIILEMG